MTQRPIRAESEGAPVSPEGDPAPSEAAGAAAPAPRPTGWRSWLPLVLGPAMALLAYVALPEHPELSTDARTTAAVVVLMASWWMTEALPLAVTSLIPIVALPTLGISDTAEATAPYGAKVTTTTWCAHASRRSESPPVIGSGAPTVLVPPG